MAIVRWEPLREFSTLQNEMNRLFNTVFDTPAQSCIGFAVKAYIEMHWNRPSRTDDPAGLPALDPEIDGDPAFCLDCHAAVSLMPSRTSRFSSNAMLQQCCAVRAQHGEVGRSVFT